MLNHLDIHWKGYPYHHLPRIRVVSTRPDSIHTRSSTSSEQNSKILRIPNDKENRNWPFGIQFRRRRAPASRAASYVVRSQGRASVRARHSIEVFRRAISGAEPASEATTGATFGSGYRALARRTVFRPESPEDSGFHSTDGPASTSARRVRPPKKSEAYSLRSLSKAPAYWTAPYPQKYSFNPDRLYSAQHSIPLRKASNRISTQFLSNPERRISSARPQFKQNTLRKPTSRVSSGRKTKGVGSPEFWEAVQDYSRNSKAHGRSSASLKSIVQTLVSESASRSPSQKRALARFTKGIELYLHAAKLPSRESLVSSPSSTSISAHTIQELKPYISEFRAAGLSVTSAEQKGMAKLPKGLTPPPTPSKDEKVEQKRSSPAKNSYKAKVTQANTQSASRNKHASYASQSTGSTVLGWTPPHERSYGRPKVKAKSPSETSSDHTIIGFTPPHELYASRRQAPVRPPPSPPQPTTKKSLPWLSRPESSPERSPTQKRSVVSTKVEERKFSTPLTGWVENFDIVESLDKRKEDVLTGKDQPTVPPRPTEKSRRVDRAQPAYEDMGTQTEFTTAVSRHADQYSLERSPLLSDPSNNFSLKANQSNADCVHQSEEPLVSAPPQRSSRPSRLMWKRVGEGTQTIGPDSEPEPGSGVQEMKPITDHIKNPSFQPDAKPGERTRNFSFLTAPTQPDGSYQAPRVYRSHPKSIEERGRKWTQVLMDPVEPSTHPAKLECYQAGRNPPSPPLCTRCAPPPVCAQCAGPLDRSKVQPEPQLFPEPRPQPEASHPVTSRMHACTARGSIQCQQCFPSRQVSAAISATSVSPVEVPPVEVYYMDASSRSTRPILPATAWTGPEEVPSPPTVDNVLPESPRSYASPERAQVQSTVEKAIEELAKRKSSQSSFCILLTVPKTPDDMFALLPDNGIVTIADARRVEEAVADPVKRRSLPRLGFRAEPTWRRNVPADEVASLTSSATASSVDSYTPKPGELKNKDVFKGLHVVTAAACDEDIDRWIEEQTGSSVRKFLAALSIFDRLGVNTLSGVARRAAKQRRDKVRAWEAVRERRRQEQVGIGEDFVIGDQGVFVEPASDLKSDSGAEGDEERHGGYDPPVGL
ncbi:uncharacterized protein L3040_008885 [Drepanopeziza brunnea f. sp. 'multigermtubi']|uniref:Uncharacterized protein n=1 Tax=Marssonina brunnea f. sp. multigermtubi (strain MB_m1) TaxID=1072389 RepID=K1WW41_MARBU|nr:uncharacterized protein MBM_04818 [Drepanopeziza brunnea f. sp. 'multigermtubi' MB_m1]EKD17241.1 hypothetical protein MBM_04818 [Drepanopeziza brunnea f. sp. 'multigermtubi' MB_m1]KAJ5032277.1 hypothetical protein L3040_008885 [Drepanopeziza brunnea f. sp. 'multigermtubi']